MVDHKESMARMREFTNEHLVECCAELLHWHKESILPDGKVRELAALCTFDEYNRISHAERMIELAALERVAQDPRHDR